MHKVLLASALFLTMSLGAQNWILLGDIPNGRHHPVAFSLNGKGYSVTGTSEFTNATKDFYEYNPTTDTWRTMPLFPGSARSFAIGTTYNGKAYMGFGASNSAYLNDLWTYDPADSSWSQLTSCPCFGRRHPAFVASNNRIYVGLGDGALGNLQDWWMYDIATDAWTQLPNLPGPGRHHPFQFSADGNVYAGFGHAGFNIYKDWYKLDTATNTWTTMNQFPGEARVAGTQFDHNNLGYVLSGDGDNHSFMATGEFWRYYPSADFWEQLASHPGTSRWAPGSFVIGDEAYFFGGLNRSTQSYPEDMYKIDISDNSIGLKEADLTAIEVYPNPASDYIQLKTDETVTDVRLYDALGKEVLVTDNISAPIHVGHLASGIYIMRTETEFGTRVSKLTIR